ncbi:MAG: hypothetical protein Q9M91_05485 [Candidatus Dojkabacteria bacterium]|nr:hypothetical protein [Candidatus Dojkabacteria bacterium]MDQ7021255.1 hypothetical protein [Candidatus Dojkabacteria bacterium]
MSEAIVPDTYGETNDVLIVCNIPGQLLDDKWNQKCAELGLYPIIPLDDINNETTATLHPDRINRVRARNRQSNRRTGVDHKAWRISETQEQ